MRTGAWVLDIKMYAFSAFVLKILFPLVVSDYLLDLDTLHRIICTLVIPGTFENSEISLLFGVLTVSGLISICRRYDFFLV